MIRMTLILLLGFSLLTSFSAEAGNKHRHHGKKHQKHHRHYYTHENRWHGCRFERHYRDGRHAVRYDGYYREPGIEYGYWYTPGETVFVFHSPTLSIGFRN